MLEFLSSISVFGLTAMAVGVVALLLVRASARRPDLEEQKTERELQRFGASYGLAELRRSSLLIGLVACVAIKLLTGNTVFAIVPMVIGIVIPFLYPWRVRRKYVERFEQDFSECLDIWTRCLQAGLSFQQAVDAASKDLGGPVSNEMDILKNEISLGDVDEALWHLHARVPLPDVRYAVLGVITCRQTGGRISEVMENIANSIRERAAQRENIKSITSMGRTEAYIMAVMPFAIGFLMYLLEPVNIEMLFGTWIGIIGTLVAIGWEGIGLLVIWKIVNIEA